MNRQHRLEISTRARATHNLTREITQLVRQSGINSGLCHLFLRHTSASLMLCENADPAVRSDLEGFLGRLVVDGDPQFEHRDEGPDDMSAHVRTVLTGVDLTLPIGDGTLLLGTWQGIFLWEHRTHPHRRELVVTLQGE